MRVIGLMSGTSLDGIDAALVDLDDDGGARTREVGWSVLAFQSTAYSSAQREQIHAAILDGDAAALTRLHARLGEWLAAAALAVCDTAGVAPGDVDLIGSHGQTVWHEPPAGGERGATLQLGDPATIAERTGIAVVSDFRCRDVAAGGEGAPLVPWVDRFLFSQPDRVRVLQNIGGIANLTRVPRAGSDEPLVAFDTGPGNAPIDAAVELATSGTERYDADGRWAAQGGVQTDLLETLLEDPFFRKPPPKSTGREVFGRPYVEALVRRLRPGYRQAWADLVATLTALTAHTIGDALRRWVLPLGADELVLTGGGARNPTLRRMIEAAVAPLPVLPGETLGIDPDAKEAVAFAVLAWAHARGVPGNVPSVTGASGPRVLGSFTPGHPGGGRRPTANAAAPRAGDEHGSCTGDGDLTMNIARLFFPAIRWQEDTGYGLSGVDAALERGVGGFILFGGTAEAAAALTADLQRRSRHPLLIAADLERGAGQQFRGATSLPPLAAFGALDDPALTRRAGRVTAREARSLGVNWVYAPVADLDAEPENPIIGTRAFGADPAHVSAHVRAWIEGCREGGALSCAKHFPGHGRTTTDSHLGLPRVAASRATLEADLAPFRAAVAVGAAAFMTAHVAYPALDASAVPATLSRPIIGDLLRGELGYGGLVVTDALIMEGVLAEAGEAESAIRALQAGCDALLYPRRLESTLRTVTDAVGGPLPESRVREALSRVAAAADGAVGGAAAGAVERGRIPVGEAEDRAWALDVAVRAIRALRGEPRCAPRVDVVVVDDDVGGPFPLDIPRDVFADTLTGAGVSARSVEQPSGDRPVIVALFADIRGFKGRPGVSAAARERVAATTSSGPAVVVLFGPPRLADEVSGGSVLCAWGGEPLMQQAAARWLTR